MPAAPRTLEATGLSPDMVQQLVLKTLHAAGELTGNELASRLGVLFAVIQPVLDGLRRDRACEMFGGGTGPHSNTYRLTDVGRSKASACMAHSSYVGRLPVPVSQYRRHLEQASRAGASEVTRASMREAFSRLVLTDRMLDQLGPGISARHSLFIYGPSGNGKTAIASTVVKLFGGDIAVPYALAADTEIIGLYDPLSHQAVEATEEPGTQLTRTAVDDNRWIRCRRPVVTVGAELTPDAFELCYNPATATYRAPVQTMANGGVLIIDDFGRQKTSPRDLLNRWTTPLESRIDHLMLQTGQKVEVPFEAMIVLTTNLDPFELLDESFIRRLRYKVYAESPSEEDFLQIFSRCCEDRGLPSDPELVTTLISSELQTRFVALRACHPRDLIDHALSLGDYLGAPGVLTRELLAAACGTYFLSDEARYPR